jgi:PAS domain S-box-containing protein
MRRVYRHEHRRAVLIHCDRRPELHAISKKDRSGPGSGAYNTPESVDDTPSPPGSTEDRLSKTTATAQTSESQRTLDALRESESRFRTLAECAPVVVWMTDANARRTYISRYWRELTGRDPEQDLGFKWLGAVHPDDRDRAARLVVDASTAVQPSRVEFRVKCVDGEYVWLSHHGVPFFHADGTYSGHIGTCIDITEHKNRETTGYRVQDNLMLGQEAERKRVARELHDGVGQRIALLAMALREVEGLLPAASPALQEKLRLVEDEVGRIATDLHRLSHNLHPSTVTHLGLVPALRRLCIEFSEQMNVAVEFVAVGDCADMPEETALALFRVGQECLANVARHSQSRAAKVFLIRRPAEIRLTIIDHGVGFDVSRVHSSPGLGLVSIHERARMLGADVEIRSSPSRGTQVELRLPLSGENA